MAQAMSVQKAAAVVLCASTDAISSRAQESTESACRREGNEKVSFCAMLLTRMHSNAQCIELFLSQQVAEF